MGEFPLAQPLAAVWASSLFGVFAVLLLLFSAVGPCKHKAGQAAHHLAMVFPFAYLAYEGFRVTLANRGSPPPGAHARIFDAEPGAEVFAPTMLGMQLFDLVTTCAIPGMRRPDAIAHHLLSLVLAWNLAVSGVMTHWLPFFFGILEVSSVPLCFVDFLRAFPEVAARLDAFNEAMRLLFAGTFLPVRCLLTPLYVGRWWVDFLELHAAGDPDIHKDRALFYLFASTSVVLCVLQFYWGFKIVKAAAKMLKGDKGGREKEY